MKPNALKLKTSSIFVGVQPNAPLHLPPVSPARRINARFLPTRAPTSPSFRGIRLLRLLPATPGDSPPDIRVPSSPGGREVTRAYDNNTVFIPPASGPVGGRLGEFSQRWSHVTSDTWVLQTISTGYRLEFTSNPPLQPPRRPTPVPSDSARRVALEKEIISLIDKNAIILLPTGSTLGVTSTFFLAPKKSGDWRPIINLRPLNSYIKPKHFRMETLSTVLQSLKRNWWATSIDLKDAYLHVPIHADHQKFLQFLYQGSGYQFRCLPFGLSTAPRVFTRIAKAVAAFLRQKQIHIFLYLDDWLIVGPTFQDTVDALRQTVQLTLNLGFIINVEKSSLIPTQQPTYLGAVLDMTTGRAMPSGERCQTLWDCIGIFRSSPILPAKSWLRLLGLMASLVDLVPWCRMHMRPLQLHLLYHFRPRKDPISKMVPVTPLIIDKLRWWLAPNNLLCGVVFPRPSPAAILTTDASTLGWGAHMDYLSRAGTWSMKESLLHINHLELLAVDKALRSLESEVLNKLVLVKSDNSTVVSYINRQGGTHSPSLCLATWELLSWCIPRQISLQATHLAGKKNILADALSRGRVSPTEWSLRPPVVKHIFNVLGTPHVDLFASHLNNQLPTFCTRHTHPLAWKVDALSFDWSGMHAYAFPPISLIQRVLTKIETELSRVVLIAPFWPRQPWFPRLLDLLVHSPLILPNRPDLLSQPGSHILHPDPSTLHLCAWMLSKSPSDQRDFRRKLRPWQPRADGDPPEELMIVDFSTSPNGVRRELSIPVLHL
ncbi:uncharacterized protein LOC119721003 [Patiria miniata]|uniref:Reverse transcriptase domain-containing protein n=1 Tax=Patiria miniata TaxID=46514 RepID=A0A913Z7I4_PATMI|nr:uncharacterized protein LOC119721003 [Patiria miniata]